MKSARWLLPIVVALAIAAPATAQISLLNPIAPTTDVTPVLSKLDPLLQASLSNLSGRSFVIVRAIDATVIPAVSQLVVQAGGTVGHELRIIEALAADVPNTSIALLTNSPLVRRVALDRPVISSVDRTAATIGVSALRQEFGYDGSGIGVAVIDSGVTAWHDDLADPGAQGAQRVDQFVDFVRGREAPYDNYGHGTHVAGIIAGNGYDSGGTRAGVAPGVRLTVLKVLDGVGKGRISHVIAALGYVLDHRTRLNIRIANLSIGTGVYESYHSDFLTQAALRVVEAGVIVVASAGNGGRTRDGDRQYGAITAPGNAPWVLTVGATTHMGTADRSDDTIADFSSRGPAAVDRTAKPDVVAPGVGIVSLADPNSYLSRTRPNALVPGTVDPGYVPYLSLSGTSQSAPVVTGTVALMLQANPALTPNGVKAILQYTAGSHTAYDALTQGAGFLNARGAVELSRLLAAAPSTYEPAADWSAHLIWGNQRVRSGLLTADANAWALDVTWGASATPSGEPIVWGMLPDDDGAGDTSDADWDPYADGASCTTLWRADTTESTENIVWGGACGGADCYDRPWTVDDHTVVWGTASDGYTVVWGTEDGDTVVWGTEDRDTVVWGTTDSETAVWGASSDAVEDPAGEHAFALAFD